ncbi:MAG: DNA-binding response regulator [Nitrospirales bacterium]|nr:MAG: DNA-binding response regulator [Nitrospirales bacterium]
MIKILIIDDHAIVRRGLRNLITEAFAGSKIVECGTGHETLQVTQQETWDIATLDINLPDKNGIAVLKEMKQHQPDLPIIVLSLYPEQQYALRALKAGASAYLTKETAPEELISAIKKVLAGGRYVSTSLAQELAAYVSGETSASLLHTLSNRELEVLRLIGQGKTGVEIASQLSLSEKTISTYRARMLEKLHLKTTSSLIRFALEQQLLE